MAGSVGAAQISDRADRGAALAVGVAAAAELLRLDHHADQLAVRVEMVRACYTRAGLLEGVATTARFPGPFAAGVTRHLEVVGAELEARACAVAAIRDVVVPTGAK